MRLLILTQKVDKNDGVLGVYHEWIARFSHEFEKITVICLYKGECALPANVTVLSLGKEAGASRPMYLWRFLSYIRSARADYDAVFVHMNAEYVILGRLPWRGWRKPVALWYNHTYGDWRAKLGFKWADKIFHTSPFALPASLGKSVRMPAGIDTEYFKKIFDIKKDPKAILFIGRVAAVKRVDVLVEAFILLRERGVDATLSIVGPLSEEYEAEFMQKLRDRTAPFEKEGRIKFLGTIPNHKTPELFNAHTVTVNLTPRGNYDKTVLESMSCETISVVSSEAFKDALPEICMFKENDAGDLARTLERVLKLSSIDKVTHEARMRRYVVEHHDLNVLAEKLKIEMSSLELK